MVDSSERPLIEEEIEHIRAETDEIRRRIDAEAKIDDLRIKQMTFQVRESEINMLAKERQHDVVMADDLYQRYYYFDQPVGEKSVQAALVRLGFWHRTMPGGDINIVLNSPGGDIVSGFALFDYIQELKRGGHKVTTHAIGHAASMAAVLLQSGSERTMGKEAMLLIHQGGFGARGSAGEMKDMQKYFDKLLGRIENIFLTKTEEAYKNGTATKKLTKAYFEKNWERQDWWLSSDEALELGFVDKVL